MPIAAPVPMKAKFGLSLSTRAVLFDGGSLDDLLVMAEDAEASGAFHGVWVGDNLLSKPRVESIVTLSALATRTQRVKLGTVCMASFPLRDPILFALQWASLDMLSHGRTILAVCNGPSGRDGPQFAHELEVMGGRRANALGGWWKVFPFCAGCGETRSLAMPANIISSGMSIYSPSRCSSQCRVFSP